MVFMADAGNYKFLVLAVIAVIISVSLNGCIQKASLDPTLYISKRTVDYEVSSLEDNQNLGECRIFYCQNSTSVVKSWFSNIGLSDYKPSLEGGRCWLENVDPYTQDGSDRLTKTIKGETTEYTQSFMLGAGPNFAAADEAQRYCGGSLGFAVQWLGGSEIRRPEPVRLEEIKRLLRSNVIPFLAYYTPIDGGTYTRELATGISGPGPIFIAPGAEFNISAMDRVDPLRHFQMIKQACEKCFTVAFVKFNDTDTLMHYGGDGATDAMPYIDLVGYGINMNDFDCDKAKIIYAISDFTQNISETWKKPSMLVYLEAKEGGKCTNETIAGAYDFIYSQLPVFVAQGMIGMGMKDTAMMFNDTGVPNIPGIVWFSNCEAYYDFDDSNSLNQVFLISPERGDKGMSPCDTLTASSLTILIKCDVDYLNSKVPLPTESSISIGDFCVEDSALDVGSDYPLDTDIGYVPDGYEKYCETWSPQIREFGAKFRFDPSLVRAIIMKDNDFTPILPAMITGQECTGCAAYSGKNFEICCGIERLEYYNETAGTRLSGLGSRSDSCGGQPAWKQMYFAVYGYKNPSQFDQHINSYVECTRGGGSFSFNGAIKDYLSAAMGVRDICRVCGRDKEIPDSSRPNWNTQIPLPALVKPIKNPECVVPFQSNMGLYWNSGIILRDLDELNIARSIAAGTVVGVAERPLRGKTVTVEINVAQEPIFVTYSSLSSIAVAKNDVISVKQEIGAFEDTLIVEMCYGSGCRQPILGIDRNFLDPSQYLLIDCSAS